MKTAHAAGFTKKMQFDFVNATIRMINLSKK